MGRVSDARERLLKAANELTWKQGYNAVTVDAICDAAGVKKGSFYHYFESKADLTKEALEAWWQANSRPIIESSFAEGVPPLERLQRYFDSMYRRQLEIKREGGTLLGCAFFRLAIEGEGVEPEVREAAQRALSRKRKYFVQAIDDAKREGLIKVDDVEAATQAVYSLFEGAMARARIQDSPEPLKGIYEQVLRLLEAVPEARDPVRRTA
ncbi:MAG TPA: TetR/AcrR family transcriptional regulator [Gammaproteobacteria bacterium]|jgi:TetR/AcrR family transcriptional repressor of nem operon